MGNSSGNQVLRNVKWAWTEKVGGEPHPSILPKVQWVSPRHILNSFGPFPAFFSISKEQKGNRKIVADWNDTWLSHSKTKNECCKAIKVKHPTCCIILKHSCGSKLKIKYIFYCCSFAYFYNTGHVASFKKNKSSSRSMKLHKTSHSHLKHLKYTFKIKLSAPWPWSCRWEKKKGGGQQIKIWTVRLWKNKIKCILKVHFFSFYNLVKLSKSISSVPRIQFKNIYDSQFQKVLAASSF